MTVEIIGWNLIGWDEEGNEIWGHIPRYRCRECGREWWETEKPRCICHQCSAAEEEEEWEED